MCKICTLLFSSFDGQKWTVVPNPLKRRQRKLLYICFWIFKSREMPEIPEGKEQPHQCDLAANEYFVDQNGKLFQNETATLDVYGSEIKISFKVKKT